MTGVIYARYSSDNQREESIEGQLRENRTFAEKNGIRIIETLTRSWLPRKAVRISRGTDHHNEQGHLSRVSLFVVALSPDSTPGFLRASARFLFYRQKASKKPIILLSVLLIYKMRRI